MFQKNSGPTHGFPNSAPYFTNISASWIASYT
jgi:hypothetical protein